MKSILGLIRKLDSWTLSCSTLVLFFVGLLANHYFPTELFIVKFILLTGILNILIFSAQHYDTFVINSFIRTSEDPVLSAEKLRLKKDIFAKSNLVIAILVSCFFVVVSIYLRFINFDITGVVSLILLFLTVFISIIGYQFYVYLIRFLHRLSNANIEKYSKFYPAYTSWLVDITKYSNTYQNSFFVTGTLYVILFTIHAPKSTLRILAFNTPYNLQDVILSIAWIAIFIAVLVGFPIISYLKNRIIKTIVANLKIKSSEYYEAVVDRSEISKQLDYIKLIKEIMESADYPIKSEVNTLISSVTLVVNLLIAILKFYPGMGK